MKRQSEKEKEETWVETYYLRSSPATIRRLKDSLPEMSEQLIELKGFVRAQLMTNLRLESDLIVSLEWSGKAEAIGSRCGILLKEYLSECGRVKEDFWVVHASTCSSGA